MSDIDKLCMRVSPSPLPPPHFVLVPDTFSSQQREKQSLTGQKKLKFMDMNGETCCIQCYMWWQRWCSEVSSNKDDCIWVLSTVSSQLTNCWQFVCVVWWIDSLLLSHFQYGRRQQQFVRETASSTMIHSSSFKLAVAQRSVRCHKLKLRN